MGVGTSKAEGVDANPPKIALTRWPDDILR